MIDDLRLSENFQTYVISIELLILSIISVLLAIIIKISTIYLHELFSMSKALISFPTQNAFANDIVESSH